MIASRAASILGLVISLSAGCSSPPSGQGKAQSTRAAAAPAEEPIQAEASAAAPADAIGLEIQKRVDHYWELVAAGDVAAIEPLLGEGMLSTFQRQRREKGDAAFGNELKARLHWGALGPGTRVSDDEYVVLCRMRRYRARSSLRVKKIGGEWRVVEQRGERPPQK